MIVGIISDTHGLLRPEALTQLRGSDQIIHAGDIGAPKVLEELGKLAPVHAIRGNVDVQDWASSIPSQLAIAFEGINFFVLHNRDEVRKLPTGVRVVVFGHSHQPLIENKDGVLCFNPGSAGPRRFHLPVSIGRITIENGIVTPQLVPIG